MKKNVTLALIIAVVSIIIIIVGLAVSTTPVNNQPQTSEEVPVQPAPEGKSFTLKLDDSVSTTSP
jgi:hypothetical protein